MEDKITIIEGPPPTFEVLDEGWVISLKESLAPIRIALTRLRTFNGPALVERCIRSWRQNQTIHLEYRDSDGLERAAPIVAARALETEEGHLLMLWVTLNIDEIEFEIDEDTGDDSDPDDFDLSE